MIVASGFRPAWWLRNAHLQTVLSSLLRRPAVRLRRERLELPDGDFLDLDWTSGNETWGDPGDESGRGSRPLVLVLHGLEGSSRSHYAQGILRAVHARGWRGVLMHFRGCSGEPNRLPRWYHSGETGDFAWFVETLHRREPDLRLAAVGYSLGGNVLLKWLGEMGSQAPLAAAVAVSVPFDLKACGRRLERGFSRLYQWKLVRSMRLSTARKFASRSCPVPLSGLDRVRTFGEFDDLVTAPLHGFAGADDYYARSSSRQYLRGIGVPTLIIHALDDPFMTPEVVPEPSELAPAVTLEISPHGGHVGFIGGHRPWWPEYWLERRIPEFLSAPLEHRIGSRPDSTVPAARSISAFAPR